MFTRCLFNLSKSSLLILGINELLFVNLSLWKETDFKDTLKGKFVSLEHTFQMLTFCPKL